MTAAAAAGANVRQQKAATTTVTNKPNHGWVLKLKIVNCGIVNAVVVIPCHNRNGVVQVVRNLDLQEFHLSIHLNAQISGTSSAMRIKFGIYTLT